MEILTHTTVRPRRRAQLLGATLLAAAALTLAGCSGSTATPEKSEAAAEAAPAQSKADGCSMVKEAITSMSSITPAADTSTTDITAVLDKAFAPVIADLGKVTNAELKPIVTTFTDALSGWTKAVGDDPTTIMSGPAFTAYTEAGTALGSACQ